MSKWIEWVPEMAHGIHQQLLATAGKHSGVIWMIEPPPFVKVASTPVNMEAVQHVVNDGGVPVGWIDLQGNVHSFRLQEPFTPPGFALPVEDVTLDYENFMLSKEFVSEMYDQLCLMNIGLRKRIGNA